MLKKVFTIGCCGIDCGLCPRFHANGASVCPGCCGKNFKDKHPSCGFATCCVTKRGLEVCADCDEFPCKRFDKEGSGLDSFVTHKKVFPNLESIKLNGIEMFLNQQRIRMDILYDFLNRFDDGRSKSFFCLACTLLPIDTLNDCRNYVSQIDDSKEGKEKCKLVKDYIQQIANELKIELTLNKTEKGRINGKQYV